MVGHDTLVVMVPHGGDLSKYSPLLSPCNRAQARGLAWPIASSVLWPGPPLELQTSTVQMLPLRWRFLPGRTICACQNSGSLEGMKQSQI